MSQPHQLDLFGLTVLSGSHREIRRLRRAQGIAPLHGNKRWKASTVLIDYLREAPPEPEQTLLELGCGWGLAGLYCQREFRTQSYFLDADASVEPFLQLHAEINQLPEPAFLAKRFEQISDDELAAVDVLIGADICFWDEMAEPLSELLLRAYQQGVERVVLADPGREPFRELALWALEAFTTQVDEPCNAIYSDWDVPTPHNQWGLILDLPFNSPLSDV